MSQEITDFLDEIEDRIGSPYLTREIFGLNAYNLIVMQRLQFVSDEKEWAVKDPVGIARYIEKRVRLGKIVYEQSPDYSIETVAGLALPTFTIQQLGMNNVEAHDSNFLRIEQSAYVANKLGLQPINSERKFGEWASSFEGAGNDTWLVADQPQEDDGHYNLWTFDANYQLEQRIVKFAVRQGISLALIPAKHNTSQIPPRSERLLEYRQIMPGYEFIRHELIPEKKILIARLN
jgi:hypothetical protein